MPGRSFVFVVPSQLCSVAAGAADIAAHSAVTVNVARLMDGRPRADVEPDPHISDMLIHAGHADGLSCVESRSNRRQLRTVLLNRTVGREEASLPKPMPSLLLAHWPQLHKISNAICKAQTAKLCANWALTAAPLGEPLEMEAPFQRTCDSLNL